MPIRILIADDNEIVRSRLAEMLSSEEGWTVCAAVQNGYEAVTKANELKPDVIVLDMAMPVMDGLSATREILRTLPAVPILIYTLHNIPAIELEAKKAGARRMVLKPHVGQLISAIKEILANESNDSMQKPNPAAATPGSEVKPVEAVAEDVIAKKPQETVVATSVAPASDAAVPSAVSSVGCDGEKINAVSSDGDSAAPPPMTDPQLSS